MSAFDGWENFYVIVGSSAGALIGLQFVVMTLVAGTLRAESDARAGDTYMTPTIIHFGVVLLLSAVASAPWTGMVGVAAIWALTGLGGMVYIARVTGRLRQMRIYHAVFEDWLSHALVPLTAYALLVVAAGLLFSVAQTALFLAGAAALLLLFDGIHNAWDIVRYHMFVQHPR